MCARIYTRTIIRTKKCYYAAINIPKNMDTNQSTESTDNMTQSTDSTDEM